MDKKKYVVRFAFTAQFEDESDGDAIASAALSLKYGVHNVRQLELKVVAALPIAETPAPTRVEPQCEQGGLPPAISSQIQDDADAKSSVDIPF